VVKRVLKHDDVTLKLTNVFHVLIATWACARAIQITTHWICSVFQTLSDGGDLNSVQYPYRTIELPYGFPKGRGFLYLSSREGGACTFL
jgi:hypothetical protein